MNTRKNMEEGYDVEDPRTTCEICTEPSTSSMIFSNDDVCAHPFCTVCMARYIGVKVQNDGVADVKCPAVGCGRSLDPLSCRPILPAALFVGWSHLLCRSAVEGSDGCYCPNNYCSEFIVNECGPVQGSSVCPSCKGVFCFQCGVIWQESHRCQSSHRRTPEDRSFEQLAASRKWARCPVCYHYVELVLGCSIIRCRCQALFCYYCGRKCKDHTCSCEEYVRDANLGLCLCVSLSTILFLGFSLLLAIFFLK